MISTVALVMEMSSSVLFEALVRCMPVWIADTPKNAVFKEMFSDESDSLSITWFPLRPAEKLNTAAMRISFSLDDHYNEDAQIEGYRSLLVFGAPYDLSMNTELATLGFKKVDATDFGFAAVK